MLENTEILDQLQQIKKINKLVSEPNYHTINYISEDLSIIEMKRAKVKINNERINNRTNER